MRLKKNWKMEMSRHIIVMVERMRFTLLAKTFAHNVKSVKEKKNVEQSKLNQMEKVGREMYGQQLKGD